MGTILSTATSKPILRPIPAREALLDLRGRIDAGLEMIRTGQKEPPFTVVIDGWWFTGKSFVAEQIFHGLDQRGIPVSLSTPQLCTDDSVILEERFCANRDDAYGSLGHVAFFEAYSSLKATGMLWEDPPDVHVEMTADRITRWRNSWDRIAERQNPAVKSIFEAVSLCSYPLSFIVDTAGKNMTRFNTDVVPDIFINNSRQFRLLGEDIREMFGANQIS